MPLLSCLFSGLGCRRWVCVSAARRGWHTAQEFCQSCEVQVGLGGTYHYWGTTGSLVLPVSLTWSDNRYELAAFRFTDQQVLPLPGTHRERPVADPTGGHPSRAGGGSSIEVPCRVTSASGWREGPSRMC